MAAQKRKRGECCVRYTATLLCYTVTLLYTLLHCYTAIYNVILLHCTLLHCYTVTLLYTLSYCYTAIIFIHYYTATLLHCCTVTLLQWLNIVCSVGEVMIVLLLLTAAGGWREPAGRHGHSTAVVGKEVYLWAGEQRGMPSV